MLPCARSKDGQTARERGGPIGVVSGVVVPISEWACSTRAYIVLYEVFQ